MNEFDTWWVGCWCRRFLRKLHNAQCQPVFAHHFALKIFGLSTCCQWLNHCQCAYDIPMDTQYSRSLMLKVHSIRYDAMRCDDIIEIMYHTHWIMWWNLSELKVKIHIDWMLRVECAYGILNWFFSPEIRSRRFFRCASQITRFQCLLIHMSLNVSKSKTSLKTIRLKLSHTKNALSTRSDILIEWYRVK